MILGTIAAIISVVTTVAGAIKARKAAKQQEKAAREAAAVQISGHDNNRSLYRVYGKALVGSTIVWKQLSNKQVRMNETGFSRFSQSTDTSSEVNGTRGKRNLYRAVALCSGPIEGVESVKIDKTDYTDDRFSARSYLRHWDSCANTGETAGTNFSKFASSGDTTLNEWGTDKLGKGVVMAFENLYLHGKSPAYQGEPQTTYLVKGTKVYDPRLDSTVTGGSGSHRHATPSTWAYSTNNALALLDYLTNSDDGKGLDIASIDIQSIMDAADACEVQVAIPAKPTNTTGTAQTYYVPFEGERTTVANGDPLTQYRPEQSSSSATTQNRFSLNIALDLTKTVLENVNTLLESFKANLLYVNGVYKVIMDDVRSSVMSLTDDDIEGSIKVASGDRSQRLNKVTVEFTNSNKAHVSDTVSWPKPTDSIYTTYLNSDNQEALHTTIDVPGCTDFYQAEDMAEYFVRESRNTLTASVKCHPRAMVLHPGDVIDITTDAAGWVSKYFIVTAVNCDLTNMKTLLQLKEYDSSVYTWNAAKGNEPVGYSFDMGTLNDAPAAPGSFTATSTLKTNSDGSTTPVITASWTEIEQDVLSLEILWTEDGDDDWNSVMINQPDTQTSTTFPVPSADQLYDLRIRYRVLSADGLFIESDEATTTTTSAAVSGTKLSTVPDDTDGFLNSSIRPYGAVAFSTVDGSVYTDHTEKCGAIYSASDTSTGGTFPAFPVNVDALDGAVEISIAIKTSLTSGTRSNGLYIRVSEYDSVLPEGSTHIASTSVGSHADIIAHDRFGSISPTHENRSSTAGWTVYTTTYTPTSTATSASLVLYNWTNLGSGTETLWFKEPVIRPVVNIDVSMVADVLQTRFTSLDGGSTYYPIATTQVVNIQAISSGSEACTVTWTRSGVNVASAVLSGSGFTMSAFGSAGVAKTVTVTHTASSQAIAVSCEVVETDLTGGSGK